MAVPFYNVGDQDIWESGNKFIPQEQYRLGYTAPPSIANAPTTGITNTQAAAPYILPPESPWGGGGADWKGGGKWGNLDLSKGKMFDKNVFSVDMSRAPPGMDKMTGSFKPEQVQGYYNPTLGAYQTLEGKNINHLGINIKPILGSILESMGVGGKKNKLFDHEIGAIEGTFTHGLDSGIDKIKEGWEKEKEKFKNIGVLKKWRENKAIKKEERLQAEIKAANDAAAAANVQYQRGADIGGGWHRKDTGAGRAEFTGPQGQKHEGYSNTQAGYGLAAAENASFAQGGRIGYNRGRVVNPGGYQGDEFEDENTLEFMQDQGIPHGEMAEGKMPFDLRIEELMSKGLSYEDAYDIAAQEFQDLFAEGQGDSFNQEGIASIV